MRLPAPTGKPAATAPVLIAEEQEVFAQCEVAIESLKVAFWAAGKALELIRDGRLYRVEYSSFDEYTDKRWSMSRGQADKLIRMWRIAQALFDSTPQESNDLTRIRVSRLSQSVVWELVPVAEGYDLESATALYETTVEEDGGPVTAEVVRGVVKDVVKALPKGQAMDREALAAAVRTALSRAGKKTSASDASKRKTTKDENTLPWDSPDTLNRLLRQHMSEENRLTLAKMLQS
ncbi:hypothetical protein [Streptomyces sp. WMMB303]|uniref:hypothetical protein n=1 Tax=Streptomyces sp. WMMB303 TaxID=3034154 RepID=UPI0023EDAF55|nr:hypothetical protein [Streptomyces sp. WMMB303]MDF4254644.1 hypothetical protein [Streptomyces sp. WMMB303]